MANFWDLMNRFMMGVSNLEEEECHMAMLVDEMDISRLMVFFENREVKTQEGES